MEAVLVHYGVLGQKWGIRRFQNADGSLTAAGKRRKANKEQKQRDNEVKRERLSAVKNRKHLSDAEIKKRIERIKLEREFKNLTSADTYPGRQFVSSIMSDSGKRALSTMATGAMLYAAKVGLEKNFDPKELAKYVAPKPGKK